MPLCFVSLALLLTAIAAGMFLLAKTNKDGLSNFFRFVSWFIIVSGFVGIALCALMCICRMCCHHGNGGGKHEKMMMMHKGMGCSMENEECGPAGGNCNKQIIIKKFDGGEEMSCEGMQKKCCKEEGKCDPSSGSGGGDHCKDEKGGQCCKDHMKMKKDSVVVKIK